MTQTVSNDGKGILPYTKTKSGARTIDLPEETIKQLKKHSLLICREKQEAGQDYCDNDLVVCNESGMPANSSNLRRIFRNITKKAGNPRIRFHDMRHTHATLLLLQGVNPKIVSERLGHTDVRITIDTYSHLLPSMQKETAQNFGKMLFDDSTSDNGTPTEKPKEKIKNGPRLLLKGMSITSLN
ncbi:site-specific integrase [Paenibacillus alba]|uniref:site-specific integrase n=1 Tax=Paenibacillus alba TaxID=1197127 RepID=UPI0030840A52